MSRELRTSNPQGWSMGTPTGESEISAFPMCHGNSESAAGHRASGGRRARPDTTLRVSNPQGWSMATVREGERNLHLPDDERAKARAPEVLGVGRRTHRPTGLSVAEA